ncbi:hypothetical protein J6590_008049 [Homalodisca vitripennis]|nr:hypothetical protein J6590_008049 [Homalodisca vitripennis]
MTQIPYRSHVTLEEGEATFVSASSSERKYGTVVDVNTNLAYEIRPSFDEMECLHAGYAYIHLSDGLETPISTRHLALASDYYLFKGSQDIPTPGYDEEDITARDLTRDQPGPPSEVIEFTYSITEPKLCQSSTAPSL